MNDLKIAKDIYFQCLGSKFFIDREYGQQYKKFNVPPAIEESWKKELCDILKRESKYNFSNQKIITRLVKKWNKIGNKSYRIFYNDIRII